MENSRLGRRPGRSRQFRMASVMAVGAIGAGMTLGACSSSKAAGSASPGSQSVSSADPQQAVVTAVSGLGQASSVGARFSIPITQSQAQQIAKKGGSTLTAAQAQALSTGSLFFSESTGGGEGIDSGQALHDPANSYDFGLSFGSTTPLEFRYTGQSLYLKADVTQLLTDVGQPASKAASFQSALTQINTAVPGISDLNQGKWVEISHASLQALAPTLKQAEAQGGSSTPNPAALQQSALKLRTAVTSALRTDSTFARVGSSGGRTEYSVTVQVHNLLSTLAPSLESAFGSVPSVGSKLSSQITKAESSVPAGQTAVVDVYVAGGKLSEADVDINQFAGNQKLGFPVPIRMSLTTPGPISAPSGATMLDTSKVPALLQNILGATGSSAG